MHLEHTFFEFAEGSCIAASSNVNAFATHFKEKVDKLLPLGLDTITLRTIYVGILARTLSEVLNAITVSDLHVMGGDLPTLQGSPKTSKPTAHKAMGV